jgi:hypothetical protein
MEAASSIGGIAIQRDMQVHLEFAHGWSSLVKSFLN